MSDMRTLGEIAARTSMSQVSGPTLPYASLSLTDLLKLFPPR